MVPLFGSLMVLQFDVGVFSCALPAEAGVAAGPGEEDEMHDPVGGWY